jgi:hypothetical protein
MNTMTNGTQSQIDDLLDARAELRRLRKQVAACRLALRASKEQLATATDRLEDILTELEQRQGRLPFGDDAQADGPPQADTYTSTSGRTVKRRAVAGRAGQSSWKETR